MFFPHASRETTQQAADRSSTVTDVCTSLTIYSHTVDLNVVGQCKMDLKLMTAYKSIIVLCSFQWKGSTRYTLQNLNLIASWIMLSDCIFSSPPCATFSLVHRSHREVVGLHDAKALDGKSGLRFKSTSGFSVFQ